MRKVFTLLSAILITAFSSLSLSAQNCGPATRTAVDCKTGTPDAVGWAMQQFFNDGSTTTWNFESGATFVENADGTACLKGIISQYASSPKRSFIVVVNFTGKSTTTSGSPETSNLCLPISTSAWQYYILSSGTLTGVAGTPISGAQLTLTQHMMPSQYGIGAANQCTEQNNLGLTGWFEYQVVSQPSNGWLFINPYPTYPVFGQADICIRLSGLPTTCGVVPTPPVANPDVATTPQNTPVTIPSLTNDNLNGGTNPMLMIISNPSNGSAQVVNGQFVYTPNTGFSGQDVFTYKIVASNGTSNTTTVTVTVPPPTIVNICTNTAANIIGGSGSITVTGITTSAAIIQVFNASNYSSVYNQQINTASVTIPNLPAGSYLVNVTVLGSGGTYPSVCFVQLKVTVTDGITTPPVANPDVATTPQNTPVTIPSLANDNLNGGTNPMLMIVSNPLNGSAQVVNGQFVYTPNNGFSGQDVFTYKIVASNGTSNTTTVTVTVPANVNPCTNDIIPPVFTFCPTNINLTTISTCANATWTNPTATDNCTTPIITQTAGLPNGSCFPVGTTTVTYTATDAKGNNAICSFIVTVTKLNPCPTITHNPFTDFNTTKPSGAATLWLHINTKLNGSLNTNGDCLLFTAGTLTLQGINASFTTAPIPNGKIVADNTVTTPVTTFDVTNNLWITKVPLGYSSSDIFISGAAIPSSSGFTVTSGKQTIISGSFVSNKSYYSSWFYGLAAYQPTFTNANEAAPGSIASVGTNGRQAGTPFNQLGGLIPGGSGGGGSNFTGSNSSTDSYSACVNSALINSILPSHLQNNKVLSITAAAEPNRTRIEWVNNTGTTSDFFQVEKLNAATGDFETLENVKSLKTFNMEHYVSYDSKPIVGDNFYRINLINHDGSNNFSEVQKVNFRGLADNLSIFPNPVNEVLNIDLTSYKGATVSLFVYNHLGQTVITQQIENVTYGLIQVDVSNQQVGNYLVRIASKGKSDQTKSFILNK